jgi:hypothetical protein
LEIVAAFAAFVAVVYGANYIAQRAFPARLTDEACRKGGYLASIGNGRDQIAAPGAAMSVNYDGMDVQRLATHLFPFFRDD